MRELVSSSALEGDNALDSRVGVRYFLSANGWKGSNDPHIRYRRHPRLVVIAFGSALMKS